MLSYKFSCSQFFPLWVLVSSNEGWESLSSSASIVPNFDDYFAHNMWNPFLNWFSSSKPMVFSPPFLWTSTWATIELSCHFALDLLCYKERVSASCFTGHFCPWSFSLFVALLPSWQHRDSFVVQTFINFFVPTYTSPCLDHSLWCGVVSFRGYWWIWMCSSARGRFRNLYAVSCMWSPPRTRSRIEEFLEAVLIMMEHTCNINGEAMVSFRRFSLHFSCSLSDVLLR